MTDYTLYYWPTPNRGQFVRALLAHVGATWVDADVPAILALKDAPPKEQVVPYMAPPVLTDHAAGFSLAQMPAILTYLGGKYELIPDDARLAALTAKVIGDANDVLVEITLHNGAQMWTRDSWHAYVPRLGRWMEIFEETGRRHGLTDRSGFLLGTEKPGVADLVAYILWGTMAAKLPTLRPMLEATAPAIAGLSGRIGTRPEQEELRARSDARYGTVWFGGQVEASLRAVLG